MKKLLFLLALGSISCNSYLHTRSVDDKAFKTQLETYIAQNASFFQGIAEEGYTEICPVDTTHLAYWKYMFEYCNKMYKQRVLTIDKVDKKFLSYLELNKTSNDASYQYYSSKNDLYIDIGVYKDTITDVEIYPSTPNIPWCNKENKQATESRFPDFRIFRYIKVEIPHDHWYRQTPPRFGWNNFDY